MHSSKKLKKSSGATCSLFSKQSLASLGLLALSALFLPKAACAEASGVVAAVGSGKEASDAIANLLRATMAKYFSDEPAALTKSLLDREIIPNATSFVQSYKLLDSAKGTVSLSANVDLDVMRALLSLTPSKLGAGTAPKALIVVKSAHLPDFVPAPKNGAPQANPYAVLDAAAKDRFARRGFEPVVATSAEVMAMSPSEDVGSPEVLRGLGMKSGARLVLGITSRRERFENENSHNHDERVVLNAALIDVKSGAVLGRSTTNVNEPKSRRDQFVADFARMIADDSKDLFQDLFVAAGKRLGPADHQEDFSIVRVQFPSNPGLVAKFRGLLEAKGLKSVTEYSIRRGAFDLAIRPAMKEGALAKILSELSSDEISVAMQGPAAAEEGERRPDITVKVAPKDLRNPSSIGPASGAEPGNESMESEDALLDKDVKNAAQ
jgi:hypothetical protein